MFQECGGLNCDNVTSDTVFVYWHAIKGVNGLKCYSLC